ncbi:MAG: FAD-dependent monooxygenase [Hyphomicrobiaceae bacterium]|nr:monooxygenase [Hyphomicrobiaceae bacterium]
MKIAVLGGGPAGLYFSYLWKARHADADVHVFEQNPADATWGFGVVFSDRAWEFLRADDPETADDLATHMEAWSDITINHAGEAICLDGIGFSAVGRLELLQLLQARAARVGVVLRFGELVTSPDQLSGFDLIVAADGLNSLVRRSFEGDFKTSISYLDNKFAWFGTTQEFDTLSQTFVRTPDGHFNAHHYRYAPGMSTFIVECDRPTWERYGFAAMSPEETRTVCADVFLGVLGGKSLISNKSVWRNFPWLWSDRWSFRNMVLVGDALHTAHFSIGSGTRLAIEDVVALVKALEAEPADLGRALQLYELKRRPVVEKLVAAAKSSAAWYENFARHMELPPHEFAMSYLMRSGRIDRDRLQKMSPKFLARYEAAQKQS